MFLSAMDYEGCYFVRTAQYIGDLVNLESAQLYNWTLY